MSRFVLCLSLLCACTDPSSTSAAATGAPKVEVTQRWCYDLQPMRRLFDSGTDVDNGFHQRYCMTDEDIAAHGHVGTDNSGAELTCIHERGQQAKMGGEVIHGQWLEVSECYQGAYPPGMSPPL